MDIDNSINFFSRARLQLFKRLLDVLYKNEIQIKSIIDIGSTDIVHVDEQNLHQADKAIENCFVKYLRHRVNIKDYFYKDGNSVSVGFLWNSIGCGYQSIDIGNSKNSLAFDINEIFSKKYDYDKQFDLVSSINGTLEHVFDQFACFFNIHNLCKPNGIIALQVTADGDIDHGLYSYQPNFFTALSLANGYEILDLNVNVMDVESGEILFYDYLSGDFNKFIKNSDIKLKRHKFLHIGFIAKKVNDKPFEKPIQECYISHIKEAALRRKFFCLQNKLEFTEKISIFGTKVAAKIAHTKAIELGFDVVCFVDDYEEGYCLDIKIVSWQDFLKTNTVLFIGPYQNGISEQRRKECRIIEVS